MMGVAGQAVETQIGTKAGKVADLSSAYSMETELESAEVVPGCTPHGQIFGIVRDCDDGATGVTVVTVIWMISWAVFLISAVVAISIWTWGGVPQGGGGGSG